MFFAISNTGNFEFTAFGETKEAVEANIFAAWKAHVKQYTKKGETWHGNKFANVAEYKDWYGINTYDSAEGKAFRDGSVIVK